MTVRPASTEDLLRARTAVVVAFATSGIALRVVRLAHPGRARGAGPVDRAAGPAAALRVGRVHRGPAAVRARSCTGSAPASACSAAPSRSGSASGSRRWASRAAPSPPAAAGLVLVGLGIGVWDVVDERRGRRRRAAAGPLAHAAAARGVQPRHGRGRRHRHGDGRRGDPARRRRSAAIAVLSPLLDDRGRPGASWRGPRRVPRQETNGLGRAAGVAGAAHAARRAPGARVRVHRGVGQRLDRRRARRRLRHRARRSARSRSGCSSRR